MSDSGCKEHLESLFEKYLNGDESSAKEFAAYVRFVKNILKQIKLKIIINLFYKD